MNNGLRALRDLGILRGFRFLSSTAQLALDRRLHHRAPVAQPSLPFHDRRDAGQRLATRLTAYAHRHDVLVLALPRGGVPVAFEVAEALRAPLDVLLVRKLGAPGQPEFAIGAIAAGGVRVLNQEAIADLGISRAMVDRLAERESLEMERRHRSYHGDHPAPSVRDQTVIVVDDGLATGSTMEAAISAVRIQGARHIVLAVPVGAADSCRRLRDVADEVVCLETPEPFSAVGLWYRSFEQTTDAEVIELLQRAMRREPTWTGFADTPTV